MVIFAGSGLYTQIRGMVLGAGGMFGVLGTPLIDAILLLNLAGMLAIVLVPSARVTAAIHALDEALLELQQKPVNVVDPQRRADIGLLLQFVQKSDMGYKVLETFKISWFTIKTGLSFSFGIGIAIYESNRNLRQA